MAIKRVLIFAPVLLILFLLQSYFWVPTYEQQTRGDPDRLNEYITASIGDASILNPILSADTASSAINSMVFEGLVDRDEELRFRGRLARSWVIHEEAFFYVNGDAPIPSIGKSDANGVADLLRKAKASGSIMRPELRATLDNIRDISVIPARSFDEQDKKTGSKVHITAPARIKLVLNRVDQDLFQNLTRLLGADYFRSFPAMDFLELGYADIKPPEKSGSENRYSKSGPAMSENTKAEYADKFLPATEHNPILVFHLRPDVMFHDGHLFDAEDVKFTFEAIMDPKNLSPRVPDYEPVKRVDVLDPLTVRIVYKRLYSPALGTWGMGILPEHLLNNQALRDEAISLGRDPGEVSMRGSSFNRRPVGCGPFVFRKWKSDQYIALDRFDDYWEGPPNYRRYIYRLIPDL
ncbi:MAG: ABC transporter substrate-binding protein, partial [Thermodesulfobacteriota bacterium]|nr:ABC transporter substrate-binding protein [Thermodesulfobacteriota bacterium]